jgi:hypothetical protein
MSPIPITTAVALNPALWHDVKAMAEKLSPDRGIAMMTGMMDALKNMQASPDTGIEGFPTPLVAVVVIALCHRTMGSGLYLDDATWDAWVAWDGSGDVAECSGCGARFPPGWPICAACGSVTAEPGLWSRMRLAKGRAN